MRPNRDPRRRVNQDGKTDVSSVRHWTAAWVWVEGEAKPYHFYLYARRTFDLVGEPSAGSLHISAADRYVLYVNGAYVGRGPARSDPRRKSYDTHDVAPLLRQGSNTIAVRAYTYGTPARLARMEQLQRKRLHRGRARRAMGAARHHTA